MQKPSKHYSKKYLQFIIYTELNNIIYNIFSTTKLNKRTETLHKCLCVPQNVLVMRPQ